MKRILVYDVAAESGGALSVLNKFYDDFKNKEEYECYFVTSVISLEEGEFIHNIRLPWVKKSWFHRLYCDWLYMPKLMDQLKVDEVLSLQNNAIVGCKVRQMVYVHNAIPFSEYKFSFFRDVYLWVYQNIIGKITKASLKKADEIIVQTQWMKNAIVEECQICEDAVTVQKLTSDIYESIVAKRQQSEKVIFFYPTTAYSFKNIEIILSACELLKNIGTYEYLVCLTIAGTENKLAARIEKRIKEKELPVQLVGRLNIEGMSEYYNKSVLLFPSFLETVGLPLIEAQRFGSSIVAADCSYAHEAIGGYSNVVFFDYTNAEELARIMLTEIEKGKQCNM